MVDQVGGKPFTVGDRGVGRVERAAPARPVSAPVRAEAAAPASGLRLAATELAAAPPVDAERVARIRKAVAEGKFPLSPATIADSLIALKFEWTRNDQA